MGVPDLPTAWVERLGNPFLLREWRRAHRGPRQPWLGPLALGAGLAGLLALVAMLVRLAGDLPRAPLDMVTVSTAGEVARWCGVGVIGGAAWLALALAYQLSLTQAQFEEQQVTFDLLQVTPVSRRIVALLLAWPILTVTSLLVPLTPLVACLMPLLGLSMGDGLRVMLIILGAALLVALRAPSGQGVRSTKPTRSGPTAVLPAVVGAVILVPAFTQFLASLVGTPVLGALRWPLQLAELSGSERPLWGAVSALGPWLAVLFLLLLAARWQSASGRLAEAPAGLPVVPGAALAAGALLVYLLAGLWWPRQTLVAAERLWGGLHLLVLGVLTVATTAAVGPFWVVVGAWARHREQPLGKAWWRLADAILLILLAPIIWFLGTRQVGLTAVPNWHVNGVVLAAAAVLAAVGQAAERAKRPRPGGKAPAQGAWAWRFLALIALATWMFWGLFGGAGEPASARAVRGDDWTAPLFVWPPGLASAVGLLGLLALLLPAWREGIREGRRVERAVAGAASALPRCWRDNPLVVRTYRTRFRRHGSGMTRLAMALLGGLGLALAWPQVWLPHLVAARGPGRSRVLAVVAEFGRLGKHLSDSLSLSVSADHQEVLLAELVLLATVLIPIGVAAVASVAGRVVGRERATGSLGFLLLTDLSDREVAEGLLIGQLAQQMEVLVGASLTILLWSAAAGAATVLAVGTVTVVLLWALVFMVTGLAFVAGARYARRAEGGAEALLALALLHGTALWVILAIAQLWPAGSRQDWILVAGAVWVVLSACYGWLIWRACPKAIARLRRLTAIGQAFDLAS